jgi:hypothetical protein
MENNIFSFTDSYELQLSGTAMGTPMACAYATLTYGHFENTTLLPTFKTNVIYYHRHIDDVFVIWLPPTLNHSNTWSDFQNVMSSWGNLKWLIDDLTWKTNFLDLNIEIEHPNLKFYTFQKPLNLYLYIPPLSAHMLSCLKGLIKGELRRCWTQNYLAVFKALVIKFIKKLHTWGHSIKDLLPLIHTSCSL